MPDPRLHFVTSNENKRRELEALLGEPLGQEALNLPELQTSVLEDISRYKLRAAFTRLRSQWLWKTPRSTFPHGTSFRDRS